MKSRTTQQRLGNGKGFTLIEAIVAIVILSIAVPAMFWAIRDAATRRANPVQIERARWLAQERLEDVIADRHSPARGWTYVVGGNYAAESSVAGFSAFSRSTSIVETGVALSGGGTGYKVVSVTVGYAAAGGASRSVTLRAVLTEYTP